MSDFDSLYYDPSSESYLIPKQYITKGIKKNIEQVAENLYLKKRAEIHKTAATHDGSSKYIKDTWGGDATKKVVLDDVIMYALSLAKYRRYTANNCAFIENIIKQGWISKKQYMVIRSLILSEPRNAKWENDEDTELSTSYYGIQGT